jgi:septal ring factor EnvC (AmiA/AmiB activator)
MLVRSFFVVLSVLVTLPVWANTEETKQQLESVQTEIQSLQKNLSLNNASKSELYSQLKQQSRAVSKLNNELRSLKQKVTAQNKQLDQLERLVTEQQQSHSQQLEALNQQIRTAFIHGKPSFIKVLLNQQDPATIARSSRYFHYFHEARQQQLQQISQTLVNLSDDQKSLYAAQKKYQQLYSQQQQKQKQLKAETQQRQATLKQLETKISDQDSRLSSLHEQEQSLQTLLDSLKKPKQISTPYKGPSFAKRRGSLTWPIEGKLLARYGSSRNVGKLTWQGILISSPAGENIVAAAPGQVIFADWLRGFGLLIIIDHGDQYMTLYGNNETLLKQVGDTVSTGELIAQSGDKGVRQHAGLYFEIRHKGSPTNPIRWLSKRS